MIFAVVFVSLVAAVLLELAAIVVVHFLMPKEVIHRYWRAPHFSLIETSMCAGFPLSILRTPKLLGPIAFRWIAAARQMPDVRDGVPRWLRRTATFIMYWAYGLGIALLALTAASVTVLVVQGDLAIWPFSSRPDADPGMGIAIIVMIAGPVILAARYWRQRALRSGGSRRRPSSRQ